MLPFVAKLSIPQLGNDETRKFLLSQDTTNITYRTSKCITSRKQKSENQLLNKFFSRRFQEILDEPIDSFFFIFL